ncbi:MAG: hypothetical protein HY040_14295 [Planctomycetes bacterium]|nr:hypothetical protein [Planctomycetota bacterium]
MSHFHGSMVVGLMIFATECLGVASAGDLDFAVLKRQFDYDGSMPFEAKVTLLYERDGVQWGAILSAVDDRLKGAVLMGGIPEQAAIYRDNDDPGIVEVRAKTPKFRFEKYLKSCERTAAVRFVPHAQAPLLFQFARHERYFDKAAMDRYYAAAKKPKDVKWYDTGHKLNDAQALHDRAAWVRERIGLGSIEPFPGK